MKKGENSPDGQPRSRGSAFARAERRPKGKNRDFKIDIYRAWCKACGICVAFCPAKVFAREEDGYPQVVHPEACTGCGWCEIHCPDFAIMVRERKTGK